MATLSLSASATFGAPFSLVILPASIAILPWSSFLRPVPSFTSYFTVDTLLSFVSTTAVVPSPSIKFTVSYGFTRSFAVPLFCKFQPAFNTSPTVAALFVIFGKSVADGPSESVVGASVPFLAPGKLPATLVMF